MTYLNCKKVIENKKARLTGEDWAEFVTDMADKLDIFLLNSRITDKEYSELSELLKQEQ